MITPQKILTLHFRADKQECGLNFITKYITGGKTATPGMYPSAALLGRIEVIEEREGFRPFRTKKVNKVIYTCGGTLINRYLFSSKGT
jgi:hypothetical protein